MKRRRSWKRTCGCGCLGLIGAFVLLVVAGSLLPPSPRAQLSVDAARINQVIPTDEMSATPSYPLLAVVAVPTTAGSPQQPTATITDTAAPTDIPTLTVTPAISASYVAAGSASVNVRAQPNRKSVIVASITPGEIVTATNRVEGEVFNGSPYWYQVALPDGQLAYVHVSLLKPYVEPVQQQVDQPIEPLESAPSSGGGFKCADGTMSYAAHRQGACSHHGGVISG